VGASGWLGTAGDSRGVEYGSGQPGGKGLLGSAVENSRGHQGNYMLGFLEVHWSPYIQAFHCDAIMGQKRVPFEQRNEPRAQPRVVYVTILDINYFRHFLDILENYNPLDDEPMWAADRVVAPTPGSTITILETANVFTIKGNHLTLVKGDQFDGRIKTDSHKHILEFLEICDMSKYRDIENKVVRLMMFPLSLTALFDRLLGEIRAFSQHENETLTEAWLRMKEMLRNFHGHNLSKGNIIKIFYHGLNEITQEVLNTTGGGIFLKTPNQAYQLLEDKVLLKLDWDKNQKSKPSLKKTVAFADEGSRNYDTKKIMARMDVMTMKTDARYKEFQSRSKQPNPDHNDDDTPMLVKKKPNSCKPTVVNVVFMWSGKSYDPSINPNDQPNNSETPVIFDSDGTPNYGKFLKELVSNKHKLKQISAAFLSDESSALIQNKVPPKLGDPGTFLIQCNFNTAFSFNALADLDASINLMPYSLYAKLSLKTYKPTKMSVRLADRSFQYPVGIAKNMLVEVRKFTFPVDFVILEMEEDIGTERMTFHMDSAMKQSYSNDDTCFNIEVIDEILEEDFDALLDEGSKIRHSIEGTILEEKIFSEFDEFIVMTTEENSESESDTEEPPFEKITFNTDYKIKTSLEEPPTDLELKPLPDNLENIFLEEPSFQPVIISSQLSDENKNKLVSVLKNHKQAFAWKTTDIPGICSSFCKHKIQLLEDKKPVVQKQRRLNPNMQEVVKKEIVKLLNTGIIYPIADSPWVSLIHCVPKKSGITVVTNEKDELVPIRTVTGLEVDKAKINIISKLPPPTNVKGIRSFLGHAGFYRCFIKDFSKIARPLNKFIEKDTPFEFDEECHKAFNSLKEKLTCTPVIVSLNWNLPFVLMCYARDFIVGAVLVFAFDKFRPYLILSKTIVYTDHSALRHLFKKQDAKPRLIRWILLLQEFDIEIKDKKGADNVAADHLSWTENDETSDDIDDSDVNNNFPRETLMEITTNDTPWFTDFANYMVGDVIPKGMTYQQKKTNLSDLKNYFWEDPYLFKVCSDGMIKHCVSGPETRTFLDQCHHGPTGGHYGPNSIAKKVLDSGFYWPTIIKEAHTLVRLCEACEK
ncbi:reverse transcriptase domain-containing protein, partial [Tanacetum coccineum]